MAFYEEKETEGKYIKIIDGSLCEKSKTEKEGFVPYTTTNPSTGDAVTYYIRRYKGIAGHIKSLERVELDGVKIYGYNLHMHDEEGPFSIFFKDDARTTDRMLKVFENIDLGKELLISVWKDEEGHAAITFKQEDKNVAQKWGKENLPEPKKVKGKWDYSAVDEFLYNNIMDNVIPQFAGVDIKATSQAAKEVETEEIPF